MNDDDDAVATAEQDAWKELAATLRAQLSKRVADVGAMTPGELRDFVTTVQDAFWLEVNAAFFDHRVELENNRSVLD